ncbi:MAG: SUMF1/EgtB/PvdO family nonheme iron enzyme [Planctomycetaceae bacterium]|nr:SUMF1/EgtB/PvdO family nonheme iron enzyme [Planctomycetaceae bacterium]
MALPLTGGFSVSGIAPSSDERVLIFSTAFDKAAHDLFISARPTPQAPFGTPVNLGPAVNSDARESQATLSADGTILIFSSERPGGLGEFDLWMTRRVPKAKSGVAPSSAAPPPGDYALQFDGVDDHVELSTLVLDSAKPFTIEAAVQTTENGRQMQIVSNEMGQRDVALALNPNRVVGIIRDNSINGLTKQYSPTGQRTVDDARHYVAFVWDGKKAEVFWDGNSVAHDDEDRGPIVASNVPLRIGTRPQNAPLAFDGRIDEVRISKVARYTKQYAPQALLAPDADTLALYHFDEGIGDVLKDSSGNNHHGKIVGAKWVRADGSAIPASNSLDAVVNAPKFTNALGMEFVLVPKGKSWLGGGGGKPGTREFTVPRDFYLGTYEVTQEEWQRVTGKNPSAYKRNNPNDARPEALAVKDITDEELKRFPVEGVNGYDCMKFVDALNAATHESGWFYRLPTSDEWEYACRGGPMTDPAESGFDYYFDQPVVKALPGQLNSRTPPALNRPCRVGSYAPNRLGLFDMHGNVREWCRDLLPASPSQVDGLSRRLSRGGHWKEAVTEPGLRAGTAQPSEQWMSFPYVGLRLARVPATTTAVAVTRPEPGVDYALYFDGIRSSVAIPSLSLDGPEWTVEVTAMIDGSPRIGTIVRALGNGFATWLETGPAEDAKHSVQALIRTATTLNSASHANVASGQRVRYAMVFRNGKIDLYHDGRHLAQTSSVSRGAPAKGRSFTIGAEEDDGLMMCRFFEGTIDEVRVSTKARFDGDYTPTERLAADADTLALYHFDEGTGDVLRDASGNNHHGKIVGATWVRADGSASRLPAEPAAIATVAANKTLANPAFQSWLKATQALPADKQLTEVSKKLMELNPGFDGKLTDAIGTQSPGIDAEGVAAVGITSDEVANLSPLRALRTLRYLACNGNKFGKGKLADLLPLEGLPLQHFTSHTSAIADLSTLAKCKSLKSVRLLDTHVTTEQVAALQTALPSCKVEWDGVTDAPGTERRIAEWVLQVGGDVQVLVDRLPVTVRELRELPAEPFWNNSIAATKVATNEDLAQLAKCVGLTNLNLNFTSVDDAGVSRLKGLSKLQSLSLMNTRITDAVIAQFAGYERLTHLNVKGTRVTAAGVAKLQKMLPNCKIEWDDPAKTPAKPLTHLDPKFQQWLAATQRLPAEKQLEEFSKKLIELNPGFDGKLVGGYGYPKPVITNGVVTGVGFDSAQIGDISPVRVFAGLTDLYCVANHRPNGFGPAGILVDLSPLAGMPLTSLHVGNVPVIDLSPLRGMPLKSLGIYQTQVADLSPLVGMPLEDLGMNGTRKVTSIEPLRGIPLKQLSMNGLPISDLSPLAGMKLDKLAVSSTPVADLSVLRRMPLRDWVDLSNTKVTDLSPLRDCPTLNEVDLNRVNIAPVEISKLLQAVPECKVKFNTPGDSPTVTEALQEVDPERRVARWVLARGGTVSISRPGDERSRGIALEKDLPAEPFLVVHLKVPGSSSEISAEEWQSLGELRLVRGIDVAGCRPTNEALAAIGRCRSLDSLIMAFHPSFNDEGLQHLVDLPHLRSLDIGVGGHTAACLESLGKLKSLRVLKMGTKDLQLKSLKPLQSLGNLLQLDLNGATLSNQAVGDLAALPQLRRLNLAGSGLTPAVIDELLKLRGLYAVSLEGLRYPAATLLKLADHPTLSLINTYGSGIKPEEYEQLAKSLPRLTFLHPELQTLNAAELAALDWAATVCAPFNGYDAQLREKKAHNAELWLTINKAFPPADFRQLAKVKNVTGLVLNNHTSSDEHLRVLFESLRDFPHLQSLTISNAGFANPAALADLPRHTGLQSFSVGNNSVVQDESLAALSQLPHLSHVKLEASLLTDGVCEHLKPLKALEVLSVIGATKFTGGRLSELRDKPRLWNLQFTKTGVTDAALAALVDLPALEELWLNKTAISDAGLQHLTGCQNLRLVNVAGTKVTPAGVAALRKALPGCMVLHDSGIDPAPAAKTE